MNGFTYWIIPSEREGNVGDTARNQRVRQLGFDIGTGFNKIDGIIVMLFNPRRYGKIFGSKIISSGGKPTVSVNILYARRQISILRARVSACPVSSKAMTTMAAP